jgi:HTH-type transcriptional regulator/antitoxin HigA
LTTAKRSKTPESSNESEEAYKPSHRVPGPFAPDWALLPGDALRAELEARQMTQTDLASRTGLSTKHLNQIIKGLVPLSSDTAIRLELALGVPSRLWNVLEAAHQDRLTYTRTRERLKEYLPWLRRFPIAELIKRKVLSEGEPTSQVEQLLRFFRIASPSAYEQVWKEPIALGFRRAQKHKVDPDATAVWVRLGEIAAEDVETKPFDPSRLRSLVPRLRGLTLLEDRAGFAQLQRECVGVGVAVVFVEEVKGSRANGATRWLGPDKAAIILTARYVWADIFWFSLFHELGHILLHPRRLTFIHLNDGDDGDGRESEADVFASKALLPGVSESELRLTSTLVGVEELAQGADVDPGIVAGMYGHVTNDWRTFARLRHKLNLGRGE